MLFVGRETCQLRQPMKRLALLALLPLLLFGVLYALGVYTWFVITDTDKAWAIAY
jgi:hypothetical protein